MVGALRILFERERVYGEKERGEGGEALGTVVFLTKPTSRRQPAHEENSPPGEKPQKEPAFILRQPSRWHPNILGPEKTSPETGWHMRS